jgi:hypothetical protein
MANELTFTKEEAKQIQKLSLSNLDFRQNFNLIINAWRLQKISTKNAVDLIKEELEKALNQA